MNEDFINRDWGDSFPLLPATREAVDALIAGTCLPADHLVCDMPPGFGLATVEKIAINAAMAGARPEHMPIIIGAVQALSKVGGHGASRCSCPPAPTRPAGGQRPHRPGSGPQPPRRPGARPRQPGQHRHRPRLLPLPPQHRLLVSQPDGHGHRGNAPQVRPLHRGERGHEPVGTLPRQPGLRRPGKRRQRVHHRRRTGRAGPGQHHRRGAAQDHRLRRHLRHPQPGRKPRRRAVDSHAPRRSPRRGRAGFSKQAPRNSSTSTPTPAWAR